MKVGDIIEFTIGIETYRDIITFISGSVIEGEVFDLTHVKFFVIKE